MAIGFKSETSGSEQLGKLLEMEAELSHMRNDLDAELNKMTAAESNIKTIQSKMLSIQDNVSAITSEMQKYKGDLLAAQGNIVTINGQIGQMSGDVRETKNATRELTTKVSNIDGVVKSNQSKLQQHEAAINMSRSEIRDLQKSKAERNKEIVHMVITPDGWTNVSGQEGMFKHNITHDRINSSSYITLNPDNDVFLNNLKEVGYSGGYINNKNGTVTWVIKAEKAPEKELAVQLTLESTTSGDLYTSLSTGGGSGGGFVISSVPPSNKNCLWIKENGLTHFWHNGVWKAIAGVYAE